MAKKQSKKEKSVDKKESTLKVTNAYILMVSALDARTGLTQNIDVRTLRKKPFPAEIQHQIFRVYDKLFEEAKTIEKVRNQLLEQYADKDEDDNPIEAEKDDQGNLVNPEKSKYQTSDENVITMNKEFTNLLDQEVEISIAPIKINFSSTGIPPLSYDEMKILMAIVSD